MSRLGTITLAGKSGTAYKFRAYPIATIFKKGSAGVYFVTRRAAKEKTGLMRHKLLFLGQSADLRRREADPVNASPTTAANCICVHAEQDDSRRVGIQKDLIGSCRAN